MQAPEPVQRSPWAMRVAIVGGVMLFLGVGLVLSQSSSVSAMDPREQHHSVYEGAGTFPAEELTDSCYRFYQVADDAEMKVELYMVEGSSIVGEAIEQQSCLLDWQAMTADGTEMVIRNSWVLNTSSDYAIIITCEAACEDVSGWLVSVNAIQASLFESPLLMFGVSFCCLGFFTLPISLIIYFASKPSRAPRVMMVSSDGQLIPITDVHPENPLMTGLVDAPEQHQQPTVAPPFADTVEQQPSDTFVDGLADVQAGTLLTTEQIYALMRGDVETAQEQAKTGRYQTPSPEDTVQEAANAAAIASWDEGVPLAEAKQPQSTSKPTPARRAVQSETPANQNAWKDWDEQ